MYIAPSPNKILVQGCKERDRIWVELYGSKELRDAARYLISQSTFLRTSPELHEDLLSDALIKVFDKRTDYAELHQAGRLKGYVFQTMYSFVSTRPERVGGKAWAKMDKWAQMFGCAEAYNPPDNSLRDAGICDEKGVNFGSFLENLVPHSQEDIQTAPLEVEKDEVGFVTELFGGASELAVRLMRKIDEIDQKNPRDRDLWEAAQFTKLYLKYGSFQKVAAATGVAKKQIREFVGRIKKLVSEVDERMKIAVVTKGSEPLTGMELYRLYYPYFDGIAKQHKEDFQVQHITYEYLDKSESLDSDVYVFSRVQKRERPIAEKVLSAGKKMVMDLDDYWKLNHTHPMRQDPQGMEYHATVTDMLTKAHMVTTTSDRLAERMQIEYNVTPVVIKNTIPEDTDQFKGQKYESGLTRFGWLGGTHHIEDLKLMRPGLRKVYGSPDLQGKYQFCLAGYNPNFQYIEYEKTLTCDNYSIRVDTDYIEYLKMNTPALDHIGYNKPYRRIWSKPVTTYGQGYREFDVALVPLEQSLFSSCKSELKIIEAGTTKTAAIVSDVPPYSDHLKHEENCLKVSPSRQDWYTQIRRIINDKELRLDITAGLHEYVTEHFNHRTETTKLATALKKLK